MQKIYLRPPDDPLVRSTGAFDYWGLLVEVTGNIYGIANAGLVLYDHTRKVMLGIGAVLHSLDASLYLFFDEVKGIKRIIAAVLFHVDDLLATGGTVDCVANLVRKSGKDVKGLVTVVELMELGGRSRLNFPVESMICM